MNARSVEYDGTIAALPLAAVFTLLLVRWLPIHFEYHPNSLGIVSWTTERQYPLQQETFWVVFAVAAVVVFTWLLARVFRSPGAAVGSIITMEALGGISLLALLWLPMPAAAPAALFAAAAALWLAVRTGADASGGAVVSSPAGFPRRTASASALWVAGAVLVALALSPSIWAAFRSLAWSISDEDLVRKAFIFQGEWGQHLAWANAVLHGRFQGKDYYCLYGPLYSLGIVGFWSLLGRSIVAWKLYLALIQVLALTALLLLGGALVRRRLWVLAIPFLVPLVRARLGVALFGLLFLVLWLRSGKLRWPLIAGVTAGTAVFFSQEFGLVLVVSGAVAFAMRRDLRSTIAFAAGVAGVAIPLLGYYAANGALGPMLRDLVGYPGYMLAGYGKRPFPALASQLPLDPSAWNTPSLLALRLGYAMPAVYVAGLLLALPVSQLDPRRPLASLGSTVAGLQRDPWRASVLITALFGLLCFRVALGRSDLSHMINVLPLAALLVIVAFDRLFECLRTQNGVRLLALWRAAALVVFVVHSGFAEHAAPLSALRTSVAVVPSIWREGSPRPGSPEVLRVSRWI